MYSVKSRSVKFAFSEYNTMKQLFITLTLFLLSFSSFAQKDYNAALGPRLGVGNGLSGKLFLDDKAAVEAILFARWQGFNLTGLYEIHKNLGVQGFNLYYGPGAHIGSFVDNSRTPWFNNNNNQRYVVIGVDFIVGLEYNFSEFPVNLSADWKPAFNLVGHNGFWGDTGALTLRYLFR